VGIFDELFNPSARFRDEERNRNEWMRDDEGEGDPHRGPIDLDSGVVRIAPPARSEAGGEAAPEGAEAAD
jgi:hypothetical protein